MDVISLDSGVGKCAIRAAGVLRAGGVIVYPTDTLYGLGADALSDDAIAKVYAIKGRDPQKPIHCIVANLDMAAEYAEVNDAARKLAEKFLPGPLTMILKKRADVDPALSRGRNEFGIRIPNNEFCLELARTYGKPFTTTSANSAGQATGNSIDVIKAQLGASAAGIDLWVDAGVLPESAPSTVVNLVSGFPSVLREGAIPSADILAFH